MKTSRLAPPPPAPPQSPSLPGPEAVAQFIAAAPGKGGPRKWLQPGVRPDVRVAFSLRVPEPLAMKLDWLADREETPRNQLIIDALERYADAALERLGGT